MLDSSISQVEVLILWIKLRNGHGKKITAAAFIDHKENDRSIGSKLVKNIEKHNSIILTITIRVGIETMKKTCH